MRAASAEMMMDSALKQRLLGAAVLIALLVIFVPMFLGNAPPADTGTIQNLDIPPEPERKFESRTLTVDPNAPAAPAQPGAGASPDKIVTVDTRAPASADAPDAAPATPAPQAKPEAKPDAKPETPASKPEPAVARTPDKPVVAPADAAAPAADGRFRVNLGIYAAAGHADALVARLKKAGLPAYAEAAEHQGKPAQAVRVGPYADRAAAEAARLRIKQIDAKLPSSVTEAPVATSADAPAGALAANRAGGWAVQLGAFKAEADATKLRDRIRATGTAAFVDRTGSGDQVLWRVRAGPFAERTSAEAARNSLKAKLQTEGMIVTQP
jgi:DedD protein